MFSYFWTMLLAILTLNSQIYSYMPCIVFPQHMYVSTQEPWSVKLNYCKLLMQSVSQHGRCNFCHLTCPSVLDAVIWMTKVTKQVSPQTVHRCFQKAGFSTESIVNAKRLKQHPRTLGVSQSGNIWKCSGRRYLNIDIDIETEADEKENYKFIQNHQQSIKREKK
jgi:hypothetical protein